MFTLYCLHQDADLFFDILNRRNDSLYKYFKHTKFKYHSKVTCTLKLCGGSYEFLRIDIQDSLSSFINQRKFKPYSILSSHPNIPFKHYKLDHNLQGWVSISKAFVTYTRVNWKVQQARAYQKQLLDITG